MEVFPSMLINTIPVSVESLQNIGRHEIRLFRGL